MVKKFKLSFLALVLVLFILYAIPSYAQNNLTYDLKNFEQQQYESKMLEYINAERKKEGLSPLKMIPQLIEIARLKSEDMVKNNYFSHISPTFGTTFDVLKNNAITYNCAGENLAGYYSVLGAHKALMNSPGHKRNILNKGFTHVGIGIVKGGPYGMMFTQVFVGQPELAQDKQSDNNNFQDSWTNQKDHFKLNKTDVDDKSVFEDEDKTSKKNKEEINLPVQKKDTIENIEAQFVTAINKERKAKGLNPLNINETLMKIAYQRAKNIENNFGLDSSKNNSIKDMLAKYKVNYHSVTESIISVTSIENAQKVLLNVSKNFNPVFQDIGIGIAKSNRYGYIIVELLLQNQEEKINRDIKLAKTEITDTNINQNNIITVKEQEMLKLINEERRKEGIEPLKIDKKLVELARLKSKDMIEKNYFSHTSPTYGSPFEMMSKFGINYRRAGENLAGHYSVALAHESLMNSPGHRRNILDPNFTHVGIGIIEGGPYGMMFTQMFVKY